MRLQSKVAVILTGLIALHVVILCAVGHFVIQPGFDAIQCDTTRESMLRCVNMIEGNLDALQRVTRDWAAWDDTHDFIRNGSQHYITSNLSSTTFADTGTDLIVLLDNQGREVWRESRDQETLEPITLGPACSGDWAQRWGLLGTSSVDDAVVGLIPTEHGPLAVCAHAVLHSDYSGPAAGVLVMGRLLDGDWVRQASERLAVPFKIMQNSTIPKDTHHHDSGEMRGTHLVVTHESSKEHVHVHELMNDVSGAEAFHLAAEVSNDVQQKGRVTVLIVTALTLVTGLGTLIVLLVVLHRLVGRRLEKVEEEIGRIIESDDLDVRVSEKDADEFGELGRHINHMLAGLSRSRQKLQENERQYRTVFESVRDGLMVIDEKRRVVAANETTCRMHGYEHDDLIGRDVLTLIHPDFQQCYVDFERDAQCGSNDSVVAVGLRRDGSTVDVAVHATAMEIDGERHILALLEDLTEELRVQRILSESEERFRRLFATIPDATATFDAETLDIVDANNAALRMYGYAKEESTGLKVTDITAEHEKTRDAFGRMMDGGVHTIPLRYHRRKNGEVFPVEISAARIDIDERILICGIMRDISERIAKEKELRTMTQQAQAASRAKSDFLTNITHEIRTPLHAILGFGELVAASELSEENTEYVDIMLKAGRSLLAMVDDVLELSAMEAGRLQLQVEPHLLDELIETVRQSAGAAAQEKGLTFETERVGVLPKEIQTDAARLGQCLENLLNNAVKFTEQGRVTLRVCGEGPDVKTGEIRFQVEDTGIGIASEKQREIFEAFSQADGSMTRRHSGAGLGLAVTSRLVHLLGGSMTLDSREQHGTTFSLSIPIAAGVGVGKSNDAVAATTDTTTAPLFSDLLGDPEMNEVIELFLKEFSEALRQLAEGLDRYDPAVLTGAVHDLKGIAGSAGYPAILEQARLLEEALNSDQGEGPTETINAVRGCMDELHALCDRAMKGYELSSGNTPSLRAD